MAIRYTILDCSEAQIDGAGTPTDNLWLITFQWNNSAVTRLSDLMQVQTTATTVDSDTLTKYRKKCDDAVRAYLELP